MRITQVIELISGLTATLFNVILIPIIFTRSSARIGKYKYFLLAYTFSACYFALAQISIIPTWYIPNNGYFFFSTVDYLPRWMQQIAVLSYVTSYVMNTIVLTWCFVYRLAVIESPYPWILSRRYFPFCLLLSVGLNFYMVFSCRPIMPSPKTELIFHGELYNRTGVELEKVGYIGGEITENGEINMGMTICLSSFITFFTLCFIIFITCWFKIGRRLREMRHVGGNHTHYNFQYKLFILLSLQTCLPIVFNMFPAAGCFILSLAQIQVGDFPYFLSMVVTFAHIFDPVFTVFFIAEYKSVFTKYLRKAFPGIVSSSVSRTGTGPSAHPGSSVTPF